MSARGWLLGQLRRNSGDRVRDDSGVSGLRASWQRLFPPVTLGQRGEAVAAKYLRRRGYIIVARGSRGALGELDLVAVEGRTVVFVEVKTRLSHDAGHPAEAVDDDKQRRLTRLAVGYLRRHGLLEYPARFDVVAVTWPAGRGKPTIEHFPRAFNAVGYEGMFS
jgi:putative endonuclease